METAGPHKTEAIAISTKDGRRMAAREAPPPGLPHAAEKVRTARRELTAPPPDHLHGG